MIEHRQTDRNCAKVRKREDRAFEYLPIDLFDSRRRWRNIHKSCADYGRILKCLGSEIITLMAGESSERVLSQVYRYQWLLAIIYKRVGELPRAFRPNFEAHYISRRGVKTYCDLWIAPSLKTSQTPGTFGSFAGRASCLRPTKFISDCILLRRCLIHEEFTGHATSTTRIKFTHPRARLFH